MYLRKIKFRDLCYILFSLFRLFKNCWIFTNAQLYPLQGYTLP